MSGGNEKNVEPISNWKWVPLSAATWFTVLGLSLLHEVGTCECCHVIYRAWSVFITWSGYLWVLPRDLPCLVCLYCMKWWDCVQKDCLSVLL